MNIPSNKQHGYVYEASGAWHIRFYAKENGKRRQRSVRLCGKDEQHPSKDSIGVQQLAADLIEKINSLNGVNDTQSYHTCTVCGNRCKRIGKSVKKEPKNV